MPRERIGLYIGSRSLAVVSVEGKSISWLTDSSLDSLKGDIGTIDTSKRWETLLSKVLREHNVSSTNVNLSVNDGDFILRFFSMPAMSKKEAEGAVPLEAQGHIPFKIDELVWDYTYTKEGRKEINVSFAGMKKSVYEKYRGICERAGLNVQHIEFSSLSLGRILKQHRVLSDKTNYALLDFSEEESYLTFFYKHLPIFSRSLNVSRQAEGINKERLMEEIRISWEYFNREFSHYHIDNLVIVCDSENTLMFTSFKDYIGVDKVEIVIPEEFFEDRKQLRLIHLKAYASTTVDTLSYPFKLKLRESLPQVEKRIERRERGESEELLEWEVSSPPINWPVIGILSLVGVIGFVLLWGIMDALVRNKEYNIRAKERQLFFPSNLEDKTLKGVESYINKKEKKIKIIKGTLNSYARIAPFLERISFNNQTNILTDGTWIAYLEINNSRNKVQFLLEGYVYLEDPQLERESIDKFLSNLKKDYIWGRVSNIRLVEYKSVTLRRNRKDFRVTYFKIVGDE